MGPISAHVFITRNETGEDGGTTMGSPARVVVPDAGELATTPAAGQPALVSLRLPDRAGLLLRHAATAADDRAGRLVERRSRAVVGDARSDLHFVELQRGELVRVAISMARLAHVRTVVICPPGVSPGRTALALAVADLLRQRRVSQTPAVTCAVCPPLGDGRTAIPHEIRVALADDVQHRIVWEIVAWDDVPGWLAALAVR